MLAVPPVCSFATLLLHVQQTWRDWDLKVQMAMETKWRGIEQARFVLLCATGSWPAACQPVVPVLVGGAAGCCCRGQVCNSAAMND